MEIFGVLDVVVDGAIGEVAPLVNEGPDFDVVLHLLKEFLDYLLLLHGKGFEGMEIFHGVMKMLKNLGTREAPPVAELLAQIFVIYGVAGVNVEFVYGEAGGEFDGAFGPKVEVGGSRGCVFGPAFVTRAVRRSGNG